MIENIPQLLQSERIYLKKPDVTFSYAKVMFETIDANRQHILPWLHWAQPDITKSAEDDYNFAFQANENWKAGKSFEFAIFKNNTDEYLGGISLVKRGQDENKCFEIGYWLKKDARGQGYMNEAVKRLERAAFELGAKRLIIRNDTKNTASVNVAVKAGFTHEGVERCGSFNPVLQKFVDINVFSKINN